MKYSDLHEFPKGHPPSPYSRPIPVIENDRIGYARLPADLRLFAVGWIESSDYRVGKVSAKHIDSLWSQLDSTFSDGTLGLYCCCLCGEDSPKVSWRNNSIDLAGHGHYLIRYEEVVYMAPRLLLHYILQHHYQPPRSFLLAVEEGETLTFADLKLDF